MVPVMSDDDNDGQMIFGDLGGLKRPDICLTGEKTPQKISPRKPVPTGDRTRARCVTSVHAAAWPTAVDWMDGWMDGWMKWMDGWMVYIFVYLRV